MVCKGPDNKYLRFLRSLLCCIFFFFFFYNSKILKKKKCLALLYSVNPLLKKIEVASL